MDAFELLGVGRRLGISGEELREAFREAGRWLHPDGGGSAEGFGELEEARRVLAERGARLRHWLELEGVEGSLRGTVSGDLMELFAKVGGGLQAADALVRERERARSALARAMLEGRVQELRDGLEQLGAQLEAAAGEREALFPEIEAGQADGWQVARDLAFLEKWRGQVRERFGALI